jgi:AraC family transcriptional regulator
MVLAGGFEESLGAAYQDVDAPTVLFRPQEAQHAVRFGAVRTRILSVQLDPSVAAMARSANIPINQPAQLTGARTSWLVARLYEEFRRKDPIADLAIDALILEMLVELGRAKPESIPEGRLKRLEEILRARLHEKPSLDELARELGMHPVSVARAFRRSRGCTIGSYVRRLRLEKATKMLANGDLSLAEIAGDLGFSDQAHFSRTFKAETGLTPGQCRRAYLRG